MKKSLSEIVNESRIKMKERADEVARIAKLAKESFKNFHEGEAGGTESTFILGFISGYKAKENE